MAERKIKRALIAVYDKTGIVEFARALVDEFSIEIISTGGTAKHLKGAGIPVMLVEEITGFPEMLDGRVKTLHPKIYAAILADRDNPEHMRQLEQHGIKSIDIVVVNLYPFEKTVADPNCTFEQAIEMIDIGGPCLLRAAAKNHKHVLVVREADSQGYDGILKILRGCPEFRSLETERSSAAFLVFSETADYDSMVWKWLGGKDESGTPVHSVEWFFREASLRYGENPSQTAGLLSFWDKGYSKSLIRSCVPREGEFEEDAHARFSFNNFVDADAALALCAELTRAREKVWHRLIAGAEAGGQLPPISKKLETRRNLPHIQRPGATYFVTFRTRTGQLSPDERDTVMECCLFPDGKMACIHAAVVMPDHVHVMMTPLDAEPDKAFQLGEILHGIKGVSGRRIADCRGRGSGPVWQDETFDRIMRGRTEFLETLEYIYANPTSAGLAPVGEYPWQVSETGSEWSRYNDAAGVDLNHALWSDSKEAAARSWHRLLAGATLSDPTATRGASDRSSSVCLSPFCALFIKHTNACGVGISGDPIEAYRRAYLGDPNAAMGGILAVDFPVTTEFAEAVMQSLDRWGKAAGAGAFFVEVWVAPSFDDEAVKVIRTAKKWGENVRLLAVGDMNQPPDPNELDYRKIAGGMLVQTRDLVGLNEDQRKVVTKRAPSESEMSDLRLAWLIAKHTKSNAISICKDGMLIGNGAGQMSRLMSCRIATWLAKENGHADKLPGSAAASDAFFPFRDGPDILIDAGVTAIIQPGGSKRDEETIRSCDERGVAMIFTGTRHFKH